MPRPNISCHCGHKDTAAAMVIRALQRSFSAEQVCAQPLTLLDGKHGAQGRRRES